MHDNVVIISIINYEYIYDIMNEIGHSTHDSTQSIHDIHWKLLDKVLDQNQYCGVFWTKMVAHGSESKTNKIICHILKMHLITVVLPVVVV